jgi:acyl carrier protein
VDRRGVGSTSIRIDELNVEPSGSFEQSPFEAEVAALMVSSLQLESAPDEIDPLAPLFGAGLGLDSIDALELSLAISQTYGVDLKSDDEGKRQIFGSLRALAGHIERHNAA